MPLRHPSGSVQSISSQAFWRPGATSDLGSSMHGSTQEITVVAKMVDDGTYGGGITGMNCIKALVSAKSFQRRTNALETLYGGHFTLSNEFMHH